MNSNRNALVFGGLAAIAMVAATVLVCLGHPVPDFLPTIAIAAVGALAGASLPSTSTSAAAPAPADGGRDVDVVDLVERGRHRPAPGTALAVPPAES